MIAMAIRNLSVVLIVLFATACALLPEAPPRFEIVGYYPAWGASRVDARQLTVVNYAFLDIDPADGSIALTEPAVDARNIAALHALREQNPALKLVASVGGWTRSSRFSDMASGEATRARFVASVIAFLRRHRFDGIDIDWEYPGEIGLPCAAGLTCDRPGDKRNFVVLARAMRAAIDAAGTADGKRYLFTIAAASDPKHVLDAGSGAWLRELAASLDWINLMTYDYHGHWQKDAGFVAPLYADPGDPASGNADATVALYLQQGIPREKLTLGVPFYGKGWRGCSPGPKGDGLHQPCEGPTLELPEAAYTFAYLTDNGYLTKDRDGRYSVGGRGFTRHWSEAARVPWLYNTATKVLISYDDEGSVREKNRYIAAKGLRGAMFWELHADRHRVLGTVIADDLR
jgi:chitinase